MKKILFIFLLSLFSLPNNICLAEETKKEKEPIIIGHERDLPNQPRIPNYGSDITAFYQNGVVYLQFAYDMGEVEISVFNETTGEMWQQTEDTTFGSALITTSTSAGNYYITIVTPDDCYYTGDFSL